MPSPIRPVFHLLVVVLALSFAAKTRRAQDPVKVDPEHYKILFEDDDVRVLRYDDTPGHFVPKHSHPEYVVYALAPAVRMFFTGNCASTIAVKLTKIPAFKPIMKGPITHCERNADKTGDHLLIFEFKKPANAKQHARAVRRSYSKLLARKML